MFIYYNLFQNFIMFISKKSFVDGVAPLNQQKLATRINII